MTPPRTKPGSRRVGRPAAGDDVREGLVRAALHLLETGGDPREATVAALVAAAGCTPPALYHYWPTRDALLREASARGFAAFRATQAEAVATQTDPLARIRSRGAAYLEFAFARPSLFRVLFLDRPVPGTADADPAAPGEGLVDLASDVAAAMDADQLRRADPVVVAVALWSAVHGVAALWVNTPGLAVDLAHEVAGLQQGALLAGLAP